jgi:NTE family protein
MTRISRFTMSLLAYAVLAGMTAWPQEPGDDLLLASTPIVYGEAGFLARIQARTGGSREPVGLVLSGGSARAFAHIGVLKRLEEAGIVPDFIVANSMGSIIGLLYAAGLSPDQMYELVSGTELNALFEPVFPLSGGIMDPRRFSDLIRLYLGDLRLEDLPIPILVACEDLQSKREIRLAEGDFITVLEAAYALPVFFPPVAYGDHLLIDGGITNLVPLGIAMEYSDSVIVSSTFYDAEGLNLRNPLIVLNTSIDIGKRRAGVVDLLEHPEAVWIRCGVESFSFMAFDRLEELAALGYESADAVSGKLAALESGGIDPGLGALRSVYTGMIAKAALAWAPFERAPSKHPALALTVRVNSTAYPGDGSYLRDTLFMGAGIGLRWGSAEISLDGGGDWLAYTDGTLLPSIAASGTIDAAPWLRGTAFASANWLDGFDGQLPELYLRSKVTAAFPWTSGRLELASTLEQDRIGLNEERLFVSSGFRLSLGTDSRSGGAVLGADHQYDARLDEHLAYADASLSLFPLPSLAVRAAGMTRAAFDPQGVAPFFLSDPVGVADTSPLDAVGRAVYGASLSLGWEPGGAALSFAELVVMRNISVAIYGDAAWAAGEAEPASMVVGLRLGCDAALMGLKSTRLRFEAGMDAESTEFVARLFLLSATAR